MVHTFEHVRLAQLLYGGHSEFVSMEVYRMRFRQPFAESWLCYVVNDSFVVRLEMKGLMMWHINKNALDLRVLEVFGICIPFVRISKPSAYHRTVDLCWL